jgi:hypothetical protein
MAMGETMMTLTKRILSAALFGLIYAAVIVVPAYYLYTVDSREHHEPEWIAKRIRSTTHDAEIALAPTDVNKFGGTMKTHDGTVYQLAVRVHDNRFDYPATSDQGRLSMSGNSLSGQKGNWRCWTYLYSAAIAIFGFGCVYPALGLLGWRQRFSRAWEIVLAVSACGTSCFSFFRFTPWLSCSHSVPISERSTHS